jgi:tRNA-specific 2-thiouridylase
VRKKVDAEPGEVVDRTGKVLGRHGGVVDFTVGQRRGIGVSASQPLYVTEVRPERGQVVVGRKADLEVREIRVGALNWFLDPSEAESVQVRYNGGPVPCEVVEEEGADEGVLVRLLAPVFGVAPGQSAVFYAGDLVVGGGTVLRSPKGSGARTGAGSDGAVGVL